MNVSNNMEKEYCVSTAAALLTDLGESNMARPLQGGFSCGCLGAEGKVLSGLDSGGVYVQVSHTKHNQVAHL